MKKNYFIRILAVAMPVGLFVLSCNDNSIIEKESQSTLRRTDIERYERLTFRTSQDLLLAIEQGEECGPTEAVKTRSSTFKSLLSNCSTSTRSSGETYYDALGYDTIVPNEAFAALLNPLGEVQANDTIYRINHNGTYYFSKEKEEDFNKIYQKDSIGTLIGENLYKLSDGIYRYKTFPDSVKVDEVYLPDSECDDCWDGDNPSTRTIAEPDYSSFHQFNADRHTWAGKIWQSLFGNDKYYDVKLSKKRKVRGRLYAYHYVVYSESGVTGMMQKKNWIGWSKTQADELRIGWSNIVLATKVDDPSLKGIPQQKTPIVGGIYQAKIPYMGTGNIIDLYIADVEKKDFYNVIGEGLKQALKKANSRYGSGTKPTIQAVCLATRSKVYLVILDDIRKSYNIKSMTHTFYSKINFIVTINPANLPSSAAGWAQALSKTLSQKSFQLKGGEATICGRLGDTWQGMKIAKELDD